MSVGHAGLAQVFFALTVALALVTSPGWIQGYDGATAASAARDGHLRRLLVATPIVVFTQVLLGAIMRHTGAGLAIPDFPLAFGSLFPLGHLADPGVGVHFTHRVVAVVVAGFVAASAWRIWSRHRSGDLSGASGASGRWRSCSFRSRSERRSCSPAAMSS